MSLISPHPSPLIPHPSMTATIVLLFLLAPIAVVAIVRTLGAPTRLAVLIEGESLLNDGTAAVLFSLALSYVIGETANAGTLGLTFLYTIAAGAVIGAAIGVVASRLLGWLD